MLRRISLSGSGWKLCGMVPDEAHAKRVWQNPYSAYPYQWVNAEVPGSVQLDLQRAGVIPDWTVDLNSRACEWTSERQWVYVRHFEKPPLRSGERAVLCIDGVDWQAEVFLNGQLLGPAVGMWQRHEWDVTEVLVDGENTLVVILSPAPEQVGQHGHTRDVRHWKPRFAYDWDWCTRLIPLGITGDVELLIHSGARLVDVWARPQVAADLTTGHLVLSAETQTIDAGELMVEAVLNVHDKTISLRGAIDDGVGRLDAEVKEPPLWWPNGIGDDRQPLTALTVRLVDGGSVLDERSLTIGWRRLEYVHNEGAPANALPYTIVANGVRVYIRGANWVPIRQLYGAPWTSEYRHWIASAKAAGLNLFRVWGGGLLERPWFYELCDRAGVLVWQEFLQSSSGITNNPADSAEYVAYAREQAENMVRARRNHPALAIWCGGNELTDEAGVPLDATHPVLAALQDVVQRLDPDRLFLPTSPSGPVFFPDPKLAGQDRQHDVHGQWRWLGDGEHQKFYASGDYLLHSEVGVEGAANLVSLPLFVSEPRIWPPDASNPVWVHHGEWWINREQLEQLFGPLNSIAEFVAVSQILQAEAYRFIVEEDRRKAWRCSGTIIWQFNEAFPNTSCTNIFDYYGQPKPAYWALARAWARELVSARLPKLAWQVGESFTAEVWVHPAEGSQGGQATVEWALVDIWGRPAKWGEMSCAVNGDRPLMAGRICVDLVDAMAPQGSTPYLLKLKATGAINAENTYPVAVSRSASAGLLSLMQLPTALLVASVKPAGRVQVMGESLPSWKVRVANVGATCAFAMVIRAMDGYATVTPGYVFLEAGQAVEALVVGRAKTVRVEALNLACPIELALPTA
ncbi:MAG: hypothetical protein H5T86_04830 [Armatimonadetes bacterium]|nr:hypothetical protein [Armatimonadota bacterium]